jgi:hypothetical protein
MARPLSDDLVEFVQTGLGSVWALKMMVAMMAEPNRAWSAAELVRELRASDTVISRLLDRFQQIGLAIEGKDHTWHWRPAAPELEELANGVARAYAVTPFGVIQAIAEAPESRLRQFADAFRLRKD